MFLAFEHQNGTGETSIAHSQVFNFGACDRKEFVYTRDESDFSCHRVKLKSGDMFESVSSQGKDRPHQTQDFIPIGSTVLTKELIEYAAKHLNETEQTRTKGLREVREFIKRELHITKEPEDEYLLTFLRSRKFDVKRTCNLIKTVADFCDSYRHIFDRVDIETVRRTLECKVIGFQPYRDAKGRAIFFLRSECWDPNVMKIDDVIYGSMVALHRNLRNPINQVAGYVVILDFKNLTFHQVIATTGWLVFGIQAMQKCLPCLVKEIHVTHTPAIFRTGWKIVKPLLSEKIKKRITFYKSERWDSLHRRIPPAILTEEFGGQLGPYSYEHWACNIQETEKEYVDILQFLQTLKRR